MTEFMLIGQAVGKNYLGARRLAERTHDEEHLIRLIASAGRKRWIFTQPPLRRGGQGFTLLELLVVVAIIALLASYVGPRYFSQVTKSQRDTARAQLDAFAKALDTYRLDVGSYPPSEYGLRALTERPPGASKWNGPYLQRGIPLDPWDQPYIYASPGRSGDFDLLSLGKDGKPGGSGDDADISWR